MMDQPYRILVVDDNAIIAQLLSDTLGSLSYSVDMVMRGDDALEALQKQSYHLMMLDLVLPGMHGTEVLRRTKALYPRTEVIIMTSHASLETAVDAVRLGAQDYLFKPFENIEVVVHVVKKVLERHRLKEENDRLIHGLQARTEELTATVHRLSSLNRLGQALCSILDLRELLQVFVKIIATELKADRTSLMLFDQASDELVIKVAEGIDAGLISQIRVKRGEGIAGWVAQSGRPVLVEDIDSDPRFPKHPERPYRTDSFISAPLVLSVPLRYRDRVLGVINVNNKIGGGPFTAHDLEFVSTLASEAAVAIENASLFDHLKLQTLQLKEANFDSIKALAEALETKDVYTRGHSDRTVTLAGQLSQGLGLSEVEIEQIKLAAILHDIGKIGIPDQILNKPAKLTEEEYELMKSHPIKGAEIIKHVKFLEPVVPLVRHDHERWDGKGYPDGIKGDAIPLGARIVSIVDAYDAMTTDRIYRRAPGKEYAIRELTQFAGTQFDPKLVHLFLNIIKNGDHPD